MLATRVIRAGSGASALLLVLALSSCGGAGGGDGDGPSLSPTRTPTATPSRTELPTPTSPPEQTETPELPSPTLSPSATESPVEPSPTPSPSETESPVEPSPTPSPSETESPVEPSPTSESPDQEPTTETPTPTATPTDTETPADTSADDEPAEVAPDDEAPPAWIWWLVGFVVLGSLLAVPLVVRSRRRNAWQQDVADARSELEWCARELLPGLRQAGSREQVAGGWAVGQSRVAAAEDRLTVLESSAPAEAGRQEARSLRDAARQARAEMDRLTGPESHEGWRADLDAVVAGLEAALRPPPAP
jgi:hypothetical protein